MKFTERELRLRKQLLGDHAGYGASEFILDHGGRRAMRMLDCPGWTSFVRNVFGHHKCARCRVLKYKLTYSLTLIEDGMKTSGVSADLKPETEDRAIVAASLDVVKDAVSEPTRTYGVSAIKTGDDCCDDMGKRAMQKNPSCDTVVERMPDEFIAMLKQCEHPDILVPFYRGC